MIKCHRCSSEHVIKKGSFRTKWNRQPVPRYLCKRCGKWFSSHTARDTYGQHKPDINEMLFKLVCSGVTNRRAAKILGINKNTVAPKLRMLAKRAEKAHESFLHRAVEPRIEFDEMETFEQTKMKPLSIALAVSHRTGYILGVDVATMNSKGRLAPMSQRLYGMRRDTRKQACENVIRCVDKAVKHSRKVTVTSDKKRAYPNIIRSIMPEANIIQIKSRKSGVRPMMKGTKQTKVGMFRLNHAAAKIRADLARMSRRSWCTTKDKDRLKDHLMLYVAWNNRYDLFYEKRKTTERRPSQTSSSTFKAEEGV